MNTNSMLSKLFPSSLFVLYLMIVFTSNTYAQNNLHSGKIFLIDSELNYTGVFKQKDTVFVKVIDEDLNTESTSKQSINIRITSDTENTGNASSASEPVANPFNYGKGKMIGLKTSLSTQDETWTVKILDEKNFSVQASVSGLHQGGIIGERYNSNNQEITFIIQNSPNSEHIFVTGDSFTFTTRAAETIAETITLSETEDNTGIFIGSIALNEASYFIAGKLDIKNGDTITAIYHDHQNEWNESTIKIDTSLYHSNVYFGEISEDTVWKKNESPYVIKENLTIKRYVTLTIEPGVNVLFFSQDNNTQDDSLQLSELIIKGRLIAEGTDDDRIIFTSTSGNTSTSGDWEGIYFYDNSDDDSIISYCTIEYAETGIYINDVSPIIKNSIISNNSKYGILIYYHSKSVIKNNLIQNNGDSGIYCNWSSPVIEGNNIFNNKKGIYCEGNHRNPEIKNNHIFENENGIECRESSMPDIISNIIEKNTSYGISFSFDTREVNSNHVIKSNQIIKNGKSGIYFTTGYDYWSSNTCNYANFKNYHPQIQYNIIHSNIESAIKCVIPAIVNATQNFWGETITIEMNNGQNPKNISMILDNYDDNLNSFNDSLTGYVNYSGWLNSENTQPEKVFYTGLLRIVNSDNNDVNIYNKGEAIFIEVKDPDKNTSSLNKQTLTVYVSDQSLQSVNVSPPIHFPTNKSNVHIKDFMTNYTTLDETFTIISKGNDSYSVIGSVSGQHKNAHTGCRYTSDNREVSFFIMKDGDLSKGDGFTFSTRQHVTSKYITLVETGNDTGIFKGIFNDYNLNNGDKLTFIYYDECDQWGKEFFATDFVFFGGTEINTQTISENTNWTISKSPYIITENVTVDSGITLTVDPGVSIFFCTEYNHTNYDMGHKKAGLIVEGSLIASGTESKQIIFTSPYNNPFPGSWNGIELNNGNGVLQFCKISFGVYGIYLDHSNALIENSEINYSGGNVKNYNCFELKRGHGIYSYYSQVTIDSNLIYQSYNYGIYISNSEQVSIRNNSISYNNDGIETVRSYPLIEKNNIHHNLNQGLNVELTLNSVFICPDDYLAQINNNKIYNNAQEGINLSTNSYVSSNPETFICKDKRIALNNNTIYNNLYGIRLGTSLNYIELLEIYNNEIYNNADYGLQFNCSSINNIDNHYSIIDNYIHDNATDVEINSKQNLDFRNNKWSNSVLMEMQNKSHPTNITKFKDSFDRRENMERKGNIIYDVISDSQLQVKQTGFLSFINTKFEDITSYNEFDENIIVELKDNDLNTNCNTIEDIIVTILSDTEKQTIFNNLIKPIPSPNNIGDWNLKDIKTSYTTLSEDWIISLIDDGEELKNWSDISFQICGSKTGLHSAITFTKWDEGEQYYVSENQEVQFFIVPGDQNSYSPVDFFSFSTTAPQIVGEEIILYETETDSGLFRGNIPIDYNNLVTNDNKLQVNISDKITAIYHDINNTWGKPQVIVASSYYTHNSIASDITKNTTWSLTNSPYIISSEVTVGKNSILTIEPGVSIVFMSHNETNECKLIVNGKLIAEGTEDYKIIFSVKDKTEGDWYYTCGLIIDEAEGKLINCEFTNFMNADALEIKDSSVEILKCVFRNNKQRAIRLQNSSSLVKDNIIDNNECGISLSNDDSTLNIIENNEITNNQYGIYAYNDDYDQTLLIIKNNLFKENRTGLALTGENNHSQIMNNNFLNNNEFGIDLYSNSQIQNNSIISNKNGLRISKTYYGSSPLSVIINNNNFEKNTFNISNKLKIVIDAKSNFWDPQTKVEIEQGGNPKNISRIIDYFDDPSGKTGVVNYSNWQNQVNFLAPTALKGLAGNREIYLSWIESFGANGYKIYYGTTSENYTYVKDVGNQTTDIHLDDLVNNTIYYFAVSSYDKVGKESDFSSEISINCGRCMESGGSINGPRIINKTPDKNQTDPVNSIFITFNEKINQATFLKDDIQIVGPNDEILVQNDPVHISDNTYEILFDSQSDIGTYHVYIGPDIENTDGLLMNQNRNCKQGEADEDKYVASFNIVNKTYGPRIIYHMPSGDQVEPVSELMFTFNKWILGSTLTIDDIIFYGPEGNLPVRSNPRRISGNTYSFVFDKQAAQGEYHVIIGPDIEDTNGTLMDQDNDGIQNELLEDRYDASFTIIDNSGPQIVSYTPSHNVKPPLDFVDIQFNEPITANTFTSDDIKATDVNGSKISTSLIQLKEKVFRISFQSQSQEGVITIVISSDIQDLSGNLMDQDLDGKKGETADDQFIMAVEIDITGPGLDSFAIAAKQNVSVRFIEITFNENILIDELTLDHIIITSPNGDTYTPLQLSYSDEATLKVELLQKDEGGTYQMKILPFVKDLAGNYIDQDNDRIQGEEIDDVVIIEFYQELPDLIVTRIVNPNEVISNQYSEFQWSVKNISKGTASNTWLDTVYLSSNINDTNNMIHIGEMTFNETLYENEAYTRFINVAIPKNIEGQYWIIISTDSLNELDEENNTNNVNHGEKPLWITRRPYPDLKVTEVFTPSYFPYGEISTVSWTVSNHGSGATSSHYWFDHIYLSSDKMLDDNDYYLGKAQNKDFLTPEESYTQSIDILINDIIPTASYYAIVCSDQNNQVNEFDLELNNCMSSIQQIEIREPSPPHLKFDYFTIPETLHPGENFLVKWQIKNTGEATARNIGWHTIFMSKDENLSFLSGHPNIICRLPVSKNTSIAGGGFLNGEDDCRMLTSMTWIQDQYIEMAGKWNLILIPDSHYISANDPTSNVETKEKGVAEIKIVVPDPPDLYIETIYTKNYAVIGQKFFVSWEVINKGKGKTLASKWYDTIYLSNDDEFDDQDLRIGSYEYEKGILSVDTSITLSTTCNLPEDLAPGDFFIFIKTDDTNLISEVDESNNSTMFDTKILVERVISDLKCSSIDMSESMITGEYYNVNWQVVNLGPDPTSINNWTDNIYISEDSDFNPLSDTLMNTIFHTGSLNVNESYTHTSQIFIPPGLEGDYYIIVAIDTRQQLFEDKDGETNNFLVNQIQIQDLYADLSIERADVPFQAIAEETVQITWTVMNTGNKKANPVWNDTIFFSIDESLDEDIDISVFTKTYTDTVRVNETYTQVAQIFIPPLPSHSEGLYYLIFKTDNNNRVYEKNNKINNILIKSILMSEKSPDLKITYANAAQNGISGSPITISWAVENIGSKKADYDWKDAIYLSENKIFDPHEDRLIGLFDCKEKLDINQSYQQDNKQVPLPDRMEGINYLFVLSDSQGSVYEKQLKTNNLHLISQPIEIEYKPADLQVILSAVPNVNLKAGSTVHLNWTVLNYGEKRTDEKFWIDGIYLSKDDEFDPKTDIELGATNHSGHLDSDASYSQEFPVRLRQDLSGDYYIYVFTDLRHQVYEWNKENNNISNAIPIFIDAVNVDLKINTIACDANAFAGQAFNITWTVQNSGDHPTPGQSWQDSLYLSNDNQLDAEDITLGTFKHNQILEENNYHLQSFHAILPNNATGQHFIIIYTDSSSYNDIYEFEAEDNNHMSKQIDIKFSPTPDLTIQDIIFPENAWSGQSMTIEWKVYNAGTANATPYNGFWFDCVYLSRDPFLDIDNDFLIGRVKFKGILTPDQTSNAQQLHASLPRGISGPYFIIVKTDASKPDHVFERDNEDNSFASETSVEIKLTPPADLQLTNILPPKSGAYGDNASWFYTVSNLESIAQGSWYDTIYISNDSKWDINDTKISRHIHIGELAENESYTVTVNEKIPAVSPDNYFVIVRTDILNDVRETNENNNTGISSETLSVQMSSLTSSVNSKVDITDNSYAYYQIHSAEGKDIIIKISGDSKDCLYIYIAFNRIPSPSDHDIRYSLNSSELDTIQLTNPQNGIYYFLVHGQDCSGLSDQIEIQMVELDSLSILDMSIVEGCNNGNATLLIKGSHFDPNISATIENNFHEIINTAVVYYENSSYIMSTFNLINIQEGQYKVVLTNPDGAKTQENFSIVSNNPGQLKTKLHIPEQIRPGRPYKMTFEYGNIGASDIFAPFVTIYSEQDTYLRLIDDEDFYQESIQILAIGEKSPVNILPPGFTFQIDLEFKVTKNGTIPFYYNVMDRPEISLDWVHIEESIRPENIDSEQWNLVFNNLKKQIGTTWGDYIHVLRKDAARLALRGQRTTDIRDLFNFELSFAYGIYKGAITGYLYDKEKQKPLSKTQIFALHKYDLAGSKTETDLNGFFILDNLQLGEYTLEIPGYILNDNIYTVNEEFDCINQKIFAELAGQISGNIYSNDQPVIGARIEARCSESDQTYYTISTDDGYFLFSNVSQGDYTVSILHNDYLNKSQTDIIVQAGKITSDITFWLETGGILHGKIIDKYSNIPIEGAFILLTKTDDFFKSSLSNQDGLFQISGLSKGMWQASISKEPYIKSQKIDIFIDHSQTVQYDFSMISGKFISGIIQNELGEPSADVIVSIFHDNQVIDMKKTDEKGEYCLYGIVENSLIEFTAQKDGYVTLEKIIEVKTDILNHNIELITGKKIYGLVSNEEGIPVSNASILFRFDSNNEKLLFSNESGEYSGNEFTSGIYRAYAVYEGYYSNEQIADINGLSKKEINFILYKGSTVEGQILTSDLNKPIINAYIELIYQGQTISHSFSDSEGKYSFSGLAPGNYLIYVKHNQYTFENKNFQIGNQATTIEHNFIAGYIIISGTVFTADHQPASDIEITLISKNADIVTQTTTNALGNYTISNLITDEYLIIANGESQNFAKNYDIVDVAQTMNWIIELSKPNEINGSVKVNNNGLLEVVPDAYVYLIKKNSLHFLEKIKETYEEGDFDEVEWRIQLLIDDKLLYISQTNIHGEFNISNLSEGNYYLYIYAGRYKLTELKPITIPNQQETELFVLETDVYKVEGRIRINGIALSNSDIVICEINNIFGSIEFSAETDYSGYFCIDQFLPPGRYRLYIFSDNYPCTYDIIVANKDAMINIYIDQKTYQDTEQELLRFIDNQCKNISLYNLWYDYLPDYYKPISSMEFNNWDKPTSPPSICNLDKKYSELLEHFHTLKLRYDLLTDYETLAKKQLYWTHSITALSTIEAISKILLTSILIKQMAPYLMRIPGVGEVTAMITSSLLIQFVFMINDEIFNPPKTPGDILKREIKRAKLSSKLTELYSLLNRFNNLYEYSHITKPLLKSIGFALTYIDRMIKTLDIVHLYREELSKASKNSNMQVSAFFDFKEQLDLYTELSADYHNELDNCISNNGGGGGSNPIEAPAEEPEEYTETTSFGSVDPNDKLISAGYGSLFHIVNDQTIEYTIRFENMKDASASAQLITITDPLSSHLDWSTFELRDIQFGHHVIEIPDGLKSYYQRYDLRPFGNYLFVDIEATLDNITGNAEWTLSAIDPDTGEFTNDVFAGFLPPNIQNHDGEGYVKFIIKPKSDIKTGTMIQNVATIIFDWNEPIDTPLVFNTIDNVSPTSKINDLPAFSEPVFELSWSGQDDKYGSGIAYYNIFYSINGGDYQNWLSATPSISALFQGEPGNNYSFYCIATDNVGNQEIISSGKEANTTIQSQSLNTPPNPPILYLPENNEIDVSLTPVLQTQLFIDADKGDFHLSTEWQVSYDRNFSKFIFKNTSNDSLIRFDIPELLLNNNQSYFWRARFFDNHTLSSTWSTPYSFTTEDTLYDLSPQNGIPDNQEISDTDVDLNHDNISDTDQISSFYKCLNLKNDNLQVGLEIQEMNGASIEYFSSLKNIHLSGYFPNVQSHNESIAFKSVSQAEGFTIAATIYFSQPLIANSTWYTYYQNEWNKTDNKSIILDDHSVSLNIKDGAFGDFDGIENGTILHYGCLGWTTQKVTSPPSDPGGGCYISVLSSLRSINILLYFLLCSGIFFVCCFIWYKQTKYLREKCLKY